MKLCPRCGAPNYDQSINCHYCGIQFPPPPQQQPPAYWNQSPPNQPPPVHHTVNNYYFNQSRPVKSSVRPAPKPKKNTVWKVLGWLFIFPLMVTLIARKKKTKLWNGIAVACWIVYLIVFGPWNSNTPSKQPAVKNVAPVTQEQMIETMMAQMMLSWTPTVSMTAVPSFTSTSEPTMLPIAIPTISQLPTSSAPPVEAPAVAAPIILSPVDEYPAVSVPAVKNAAPEVVNNVPAVDTSNCNPNYDPCIPNSGKITCKSLGINNIRVIGVDVYGIDKDNDGIACEKN